MKRIAAVCAAVAVAATACGSERLSKREYGQRAFAILMPLNETDTFQGGIDLTAAEIADDQRGFRAAADRLDALEPPADAERLNTRLAEGLRGLADVLERARLAALRGHPGRAAQIIGNMPRTRSQERWLAAVQALAKYRYGPKATIGE